MGSKDISWGREKAEREGEQNEKEVWEQKGEPKRKTGIQNTKGEMGGGGLGERPRERIPKKTERKRNWLELLQKSWVPCGATSPPGVTNRLTTGRALQEPSRRWSIGGGSDLNM